MWTCAGVLALAACALGITRDQFYPHGADLDQRLPKGHEVPSPEVNLKVPVVFFGETYESVYVNNFGVLSFRADISSFLNTEFPLPYPSIAAFYTNVDTTYQGAVYYRETDEPHVISKAEESVQNNFHDYYDFKPTSVFITTWLDVTYSNATHRRNSFQIAIISNGTESFVELLYPEREIQWIQRETQLTSLPDAKAQAGFIAEDGRIFTLRGSGSHQIRNIISWSNTHEPGKYVFRIGDISPEENIAVPDQYNQNEVEVEEESKTCAQTGPSMCHIQARCVDYQAGICCQCNDGFYGNGKSCIKDDVPLRVHGKLNGIINDINLNDVDIQAYVVVADGRAYTALSLVPPSLGSSLQLLNVLGGVVGWVFAKPSGSARNGYQLTGSLFNHTADILFPATGDRVTVNQEYLGHDVFDQITIETDVRGNVPVILTGTKIEVTEYEEQYTMVEPGLIRSESTKMFTNKITGEKYEQKVSQSFSYNPCRFATATVEDTVPVTLKVSKNYLGYETSENIVRYGTSNKIVPLGQEDPCIQGRSSCGPHSTCVVQRESFTCICQSGFSNIYLDDRETCIDIDECTAGTHNCDNNADCYNHDGGFQCRCRAGFEGDGARCARVSRCQDKKCDINAQCIENAGEEPFCTCNSGYTGDGQTCWQTPEYACAHCSPYASCPFSPTFNSYICTCDEGFSGDGYRCTEIVSDFREETTRTPTTTTATYEAEYNETFVLPNCDAYSCVCPPGYSNYRDERNNELCRIDSYDLPNVYTESTETSIRCDTDTDCPPNAMCSYSTTDSSPSSEGQYLGHCVCPEGYEGDAYECIERTGSQCSCGLNAHCITTAADELICVCDSSYHGDGYVCRPNFSCTNNSDCEFNAECRPNPVNNEFICQCIKGYVKDQNEACIPDGQLCNGALCSEHASCLYDETMAVSYCQCDEGYDGEGISQCVPKGRTCDVLNDCNADAACTLLENSYQCVCRDGFVGDGYSCTAEMTCRTNLYLCSAHASCLQRSDGFVCECNTGYNGNGSYCELNPRAAGNFLVVSEGATIYRVPFKATPRDFPIPFVSSINQIAVGIDVDCVSGRIYWGDVVGNTIKRASYDGSGFEHFLRVGIISPEGIAVDWSARNIFWTDSKKLTIEVANLDTKIRKVLFAVEGISNPRGIVVHSQRGKIFWSDWHRSVPKIEWANMDGSQRGVFLDKTDVSLPNSLAIDWARERLCYADAGINSIKCVGIDTMERQTIASSCSYPFSLAIKGDTFFWSDWKTHKIEYIDTSNHNRGQLPMPATSSRLYGVAVAPDQCPAASNVCSQRNGGCHSGQLCLPNGQGGRSCVDGDNTYQEV